MFVYLLNYLKMKNICIASLMILISYFSLAQEDEGKGFRFGLKGDMSIDWLSIDNQKKFSSAGVGMGWGIGAQMEFKINKTTSFITGLNLISARGGVNYFDSELNSVDSTFYVRNSDEEFVAWESAFYNSGVDTGKTVLSFVCFSGLNLWVVRLSLMG